LIDKKIWDKINVPGSSDPIAGAQESALASMLSTDRLHRMQVNVDRFGADKVYAATEMINDLQNDLFSELKSGKAIDMYRRMLQKSYVDKLDAIINPKASAGGITISFGGGGGFNNPYGSGYNSRSDVNSIARAQLVALKGTVSAAAASTSDKMTKMHLADLAQTIKLALDPK